MKRKNNKNVIEKYRIVWYNVNNNIKWYIIIRRGVILMDEVFDKIKEQAYKAKDGAVKLTKTVIDKTNNVVNQTKLRFAISETKEKIEDVYTEIGKTVYEKYQNDGEICDCVIEKCGKIDALSDELAELKENLAELKENVKCSECGSYNHSDDVYCSKCGTKLEKNDEEAEYDFSVNTAPLDEEYDND